MAIANGDRDRIYSITDNSKNHILRRIKNFYQLMLNTLQVTLTNTKCGDKSLANYVKTWAKRRTFHETNQTT